MGAARLSGPRFLKSKSGRQAFSWGSFPSLRPAFFRNVSSFFLRKEKKACIKIGSVENNKASSSLRWFILRVTKRERQKIRACPRARRCNGPGQTGRGWGEREGKAVKKELGRRRSWRGIDVLASRAGCLTSKHLIYSACLSLLFQTHPTLYHR